MTPPLVVLAGPPGIGKSTLLNALAGREVAVTAADAGTTRDPVMTTVELDGLVVRWADTAGVDTPRGPIDARSQNHARRLAATADLLVLAGDHRSGLTAITGFPPADLRLGLRSDLGPIVGADLEVHRGSGAGLADLARRIRQALVADEDLEADRPWGFPGSPGALTVRPASPD